MFSKSVVGFGYKIKDSLLTVVGFTSGAVDAEIVAGEEERAVFVLDFIVPSVLNSIQKSVFIFVKSAVCNVPKINKHPNDLLSFGTVNLYQLSLIERVILGKLAGQLVLFVMATSVPVCLLQT